MQYILKRGLCVGLMVCVVPSLGGCGWISALWGLRTQQETPQLSVADFAWYNAGQERFALNDLAPALKSLPVEIAREPWAILVHGAGPYPEKAWHEKSFQRLQANYGISALMFHWPAFIDWRTIPRQNASQAGPFFANGLKQLNGLFMKGDIAEGRRTLLLHSMGTEVLRAAMKDVHGKLSRQLFDAVVLIAPETELAGHALWVEQIDFSRQVFVLVHANDRVLRSVRRHLGRTRLGRGLTHPNGDPEPLASNALYINVTAQAHRHSYYLFSKKAGVLHLLRLLLTEDAPGWLRNHLEPTDNPRYWQLPPSAENGPYPPLPAASP